MLSAKRAREIADTMAGLNAHETLVDILKKVMEECSSPTGRSYIYYDIEYKKNQPLSYVVDALNSLGYKLEVSEYPEDKYASLTVRW